MITWLKNGVDLGWLIDPFKKKVWVYQQNQEPQLLEANDGIEGTGSLAGLHVSRTPRRDLRSV